MKNVLLMGNGMNRAYRSEAFSWQKLLEDMTTVENLPEHKNLPFPLEVVLRTNDQVDKALVQFSGQMYGSVESEKMRCVLAELLKLGFDEILTTNYDYTLEGTAIYPKKVTNAWLKKTMQHTNEVAKAESAYLLHTYQSVEFKGVPNRIWHIHGEARKPSSIVIGHYMYVNLVSKWREKLKERADKYKTWDYEKESACWLDSFVLGNVYVLGLGMDFSELDLWWLLNRKKREKAEHGKVIFYDPEKPGDEAKYALLRAYGAEIRHLGFKLLPYADKMPCDDDLQEEEDLKERKVQKYNAGIYADFYGDAIEDIKKEMGNLG